WSTPPLAESRPLGASQAQWRRAPAATSRRSPYAWVSLPHPLRSRKRVAEVRIEGNPVGLANGPTRRQRQMDEVGDVCPQDAGAGIGATGVAVAVEG